MIYQKTLICFIFFFFFKQKTAYEIMPSLVGSEMCIRDSLYYEQYYTELEQDNQEMKITWKLEYATNQEPYNLPDLTLGSMTQLAERLNSNKTLFNYYYAYNNIMSKQDNCGFRCKRNQMCAIVQPYWDKYLTCLLIGPKHYLPKSYTDVQDELD
eukprot:TRINITY_DN10843_c0_g1_i2.p2 TRINITY_DN10843_c0_g1~~TRINITY_DN10843_c0_g1_i2.p2  ORF type:complete len:155 (+),score=28.13 TRINITY_DN10843_c0_g1_i2:3-467(+)